MFALLDCNNFFASCERVFRPDLTDKPLVVLSNNDGCVIARSNEAKQLGISMGAPYFKVKSFCKAYRVHVFSSNYTLYSDLSYRVMSIIEECWPEIEIYSIDEAFLDLSSLPLLAQYDFCDHLQQRILKETGIPTSIGIGKTKTLAKLANHVAKKILKMPVFNIENNTDYWLKKIPIEEVWGIGRKNAPKLRALGIQMSGDLADAPIAFLQKKFNIVLVQTALELRGVPCQSLAVDEKRKSIVSSRSFGMLQTEYTQLAEAVSSHCARAYEKLREQQLLAQHITVFIRSNRFRLDLPTYNNALDYTLDYPTDDCRLLTQIAKLCLKRIFKSGIHYNKVGIQLTHLSEKNSSQGALWPTPTPYSNSEALMSVLDSINHKFGSRTVRLAAEGFKKSWSMKQEIKSPAYTTKWEEIPQAY